MTTPFKQLAPCSNCPFLREGAIELSAGRLQEIISTLLRGGGFLCHKRFYAAKRERQPCAGAVIYLEKANQPNQVMQVMERLDAYPREEFMRHAERIIEPRKANEEVHLRSRRRVRRRES